LADTNYLCIPTTIIIILQQLELVEQLTGIPDRDSCAPLRD